jgi:hypothetical protein
VLHLFVFLLLITTLSLVTGNFVSRVVSGPPEPVIDVSQYHQTYKFKDNSRLHKALAKKCPEMVTLTNKYYTLYTILIILKRLIITDQLFDKENPTIIILNLFLELALNVRVLHISQMREFILAQMEDTNLKPVVPKRPKFYTLQFSHTVSHTLHARGSAQCPIRHPAPEAAPTPAPAAAPIPAPHLFPRLEAQIPQSFAVPEWASVNAKALVYKRKTDDTFDNTANYRMDFRLLSILLEDSDKPESERQPKDFYNYAVICKMVSDYVIKNKDTLFDIRNIYVALIDEHPLGEVFGTKAVARSQISYFIRAFLTKVEDDPKPVPSAPPQEEPNPDDDTPLVMDLKREVNDEPDTTN